MREHFKVSDFVKYIGDQTTLQPIIRNEDFAKIISLEERNRYFICGLELMKSKAKLSCFVDKIRPVLTEDKHLIKLGFKEITKGCFIKDDIIISKMYVYLESVSLHFFSGYCLADFRYFNDDFLNKYIVSNKFDVELFYKDFNSLNNINDLFELLKLKGYDIDEVQIL